ncbi:C39 family peptidase [Brevundimonas sp. NPDC090276]|uniref:C39 family peptidase n=1 Tax=Brevundimonas sp. NPDC090276 TaxID=3363956 RepID=UPI00383A0C61
MSGFTGVAAAAVLTAAGLVAPATAQVAISQGGGNYSVQVVSYRDIPFRTVVRQEYDYSCGSAALATLLRYHYGRDVAEHEVFLYMYENGNREAIERVGFSLLDMKRYLETHGFESDGFRMSLDALEEAGAPAIVVINQQGYRHFVVLKGMAGDRVLVGDPALGLRAYSREEFTSMWNGIAFMIRDSADHYNLAADWRPFAKAPMDRALPTDSLAELTRELPPLYQITTTFSLDPYLR